MAESSILLIGCAEAGATQRIAGREQIGAKAHALARMAALGLPVPPAFVIGTAWCERVDELQPSTWAGALQELERVTGRRLGDPRHPLVLSVRSGAPMSMPGMLETLLDVGLCDGTLPGFVRLTGNPRLAWDAYRRLAAGFGEVVMGVAAAAFERDLAAVARGRDERELDFAELRQITRLHLATVQRECGRAFPQDAAEQLRTAVVAVMRSWHGEKAQAYRRMTDLPESAGTAVTVQAMVFGNAGGTSGSGVAFTRHPSTGAPEPWVDFLFKAQGEDVVSGRRSAGGAQTLADVAPDTWAALLGHLRTLESAFGDMQDVEFTVENGRLWLLQTRSGKRTAQACARIALDLCDEGLIDAEAALERTRHLDRRALEVERVVDGGAEALVVATAVPASNGVAWGEIALDAERAARRRAAGVSVVLVRPDAETGDIEALGFAGGIVTARGARTSHAAVVARQLGKVCLVGCEDLSIDLARRRVRMGMAELSEGDCITIDGHRGVIYRGAVRTVRDVPDGLFERLSRLRAR